MTNGIDIPAIVSTATVAFAVSALCLLISHLWVTVARRINFRSRFQDQILFEPGQILRQHVREIDALCYRHLTAVLVFSVCFLTLMLLGRRDWWANLPLWLWIVIGITLTGAMGFYLREFIMLCRARFRVAYLRDANIAMGHGLMHAAPKGNRVFHSVPIAGEVIDNVVVGANGVYAVSVVAPPHQLAKSARLEGDSLVFEPGDASVKLERHRKKLHILAKELGPVVGHPVTILSVLGVPGCQISSTGTDKHLVVNERNSVMITGWRVPDAYLMSEEVDKISEFLMKRCRRGKANRINRKRITWKTAGLQPNF